MRTGCQWNAISRSFASSSTIHDYFQRWVEEGVFEKLWKFALEEYDEIKGIVWKHQPLDVAIVKFPLSGKKRERIRQIEASLDANDPSWSMFVACP